MIEKFRKKVNINFATFFLFTIILSFVMPIYSQAEIEEYSSKKNELILNEGDNYGIYPSDWYEKGFQKPISKKKLKLLLKNTQIKLDEIGLKENIDFQPIEVSDNVKRGIVLTHFYNIINSYQLPKILEDKEDNLFNYFQNMGIIKKSKKKLDKDSKCTVEQACVWAVQIIENIYEAADAGSKGLLWKAQKNGNTVYLLGSIHVGQTNLYPFHKQLKDIFEKSEALYVEVNLLDIKGSLYLLQKGMYSDGTTLKDHVSEEIYNKTVQALEKSNLKPIELYTRYKPWFIATVLENILGTDSKTITDASTAANLGIDMYFTKKAFLMDKPIVELEGIQFQTDIFDSLSDAYQEEYLLSSVNSILNPDIAQEEEKDLLVTWQQQWKDRDFDGFKSSYRIEEDKEEDEFTTKLLGDRDKAMAQKIGKLLDKDGEHTYFVVIGAAHLALDNMTIDQLKLNGYKVEEVE